MIEAPEFVRDGLDRETARILRELREESYRAHREIEALHQSVARQSSEALRMCKEFGLELPWR